MTIVQINTTCGIGSTGQIVADLHHAAKAAGYTSCVFWASACSERYRHEADVIRIGNTLDHKIHALLRRINLSQGFNSRYATKRLCGQLRELAPDVVHLHNLHSNYINLPFLFRFLAENKIPTVITLHDCWFFTGHCTHFTTHSHCTRWQEAECVGCPAVKTFQRRKVAACFEQKKQLFAALSKLGVIGVSDWITECGKRSLCGQARLFKRIYNWIDTSVFYPRTNTEAVRAKYGIAPTQKMILGVAQGWSDEKGLAEFKLLAEQLGEEATIILVGNPEGNHSTNNLKFIGYTSSADELAQLYAAADVFVNPSKAETFGKVTAEALSCGTPVVAYDNTGTAELVNDHVGALVEDGNKDALLHAVGRVLQTDQSTYREACRQFAHENFNKAYQLALHLQLYRELCQN